MGGAQGQFKVRFWGVRGSIPSPGPDTVRYGGNTPCVEMQVNGQRLIFDGGTGLRMLGRSLKGQTNVEAHLFFSHYHWDHVQGFPFFEPAFAPGNRFHLYGAIALDGSSVEQRLALQMLHPNFPVSLQIMASNLQFHDLRAGDTFALASHRCMANASADKHAEGHGAGCDSGITIETAPLNHPGESVGYRVNYQGRAAVYVTDTEHYPDRLDEHVLHLARDADILIHDCTYTDDEYHHPITSKVGWGHSTWQEAIKLARAARVKKLIIFHHDPSHDDDFLDGVALAAKAVMSSCQLAHEGLELEILPVATSVQRVA